MSGVRRRSEQNDSRKVRINERRSVGNINTICKCNMSHERDRGDMMIY